MQRKLTTTIADEGYRGLHQQIGRGEISRFIETLIRPYIVTDDDLEAEYREAAHDMEAEQEALEWIEANLDEALDLPSTYSQPRCCSTCLPTCPTSTT